MIAEASEVKTAGSAVADGGRREQERAEIDGGKRGENGTAKAKAGRSGIAESGIVESRFRCDFL